MSFKQDDLGAYNDEEIPEGLKPVYHIDEANDAIADEENIVLARYGGGSIESSIILQEKRKAEFMVKQANGEIIIRKDKNGADRVYKLVKQSVGKNGNIVIEFEKVRSFAIANA